MKCPECGSEIVAGEKFCGNCGAPVEGGESAPETVAEMPSTSETIVTAAPVVADLEPEDAPPLAAEAYEPPPAPPPAAPAGNPNRKMIWIIVAVVVVLLLCCCCIIGLAVVFSEDIAYMVEDLAMVLPQIQAVA